MRKRWIQALFVANPILLWTAAWMISDQHRTGAIALLICAIAVQLTGFERNT